MTQRYVSTKNELMYTFTNYNYTKVVLYRLNIYVPKIQYYNNSVIKLLYWGMI